MTQFLRLVLISFYVFAGVYHFVNPTFYLELIPDYLPYKQLINYLSGALEIVLAVGVAIPKTRSLAVKGLLLLLVAFIPSHVYFITQGSCIPVAFCVSPWIAWVRLLVIHPLLMLWVWHIRPID